MQKGIEIYHTPVLKERVFEFLKRDWDTVFLDCTVGAGGHAEFILQRAPWIKLYIGIDRDKDILTLCKKRLSKFKDRVHLYHGNFSNFDNILQQESLDSVGYMLLDLGISSYQIDDPKRGFSFMKDGPLDMRMDKGQKKSLKDFLTEWNEKELARILNRYGEVKNSYRYARAILRDFQENRIKKTGDLAKSIEEVMPPSMRYRSYNLLAKIFQALRIVVNRELEELSIFLKKFINWLRVGGRVFIISFHSLEDRMVKQCFRYLEKDCICPPSIPYCRCNKKRQLIRLNKKVIKPDKSEIAHNPRARSAKLRAGEKIDG